MATSDVAHGVHKAAAAARSLLQDVMTATDDDDTAAIIVETETDLPQAIEAAVDRVAMIDMHIAALSERIKSLQERKSRLANSNETLRQALVSAMESTGTQKLECPTATVSLKRVPPSLVLTGETWPAEFLRQPPPVPDKAAIAAAIKAGREVPGAHMSNGGITVQIR